MDSRAQIFGIGQGSHRSRGGNAGVTLKKGGGDGRLASSPWGGKAGVALKTANSFWGSVLVPVGKIIDVLPIVSRLLWCTKSNNDSGEYPSVLRSSMPI